METRQLELTKISSSARRSVFSRKRVKLTQGELFSIFMSEYFLRVYSISNKKRNTPIYFNTNYRTEIKLVPIIMDYCLLQFDALKFFLGGRLHGGSLPNFNFFNEIVKFTSQVA